MKATSTPVRALLAALAAAALSIPVAAQLPPGPPAANWNDSPMNWQNSPQNWNNTSANWNNSPNNWNNSPQNWTSDNGVSDNRGNRMGYETRTPDGVTNIYDNQGNRLGYVPAGQAPGPARR